MSVRDAGEVGCVSSEEVDGGRLSVRLERRGDRYRQWVRLQVGGETRDILESIEGDGADSWPPSPALQQLLMEDRGAAGVVGLLVGMAGRAHWSLSIEGVAGRVALRWDAACRVPSEPGFLGHSWRVLQGKLRIDREGLGTLEVGGGALEIFVARADTPTDAGRVLWDASEDERMVRILAPPLAPVRFPATARWGFCVEWRPTGPSVSTHASESR